MRAGSCLAFALGLQGCALCVRAVGSLDLLWDGLVVPGCLLISGFADSGVDDSGVKLAQRSQFRLANGGLVLHFEGGSVVFERLMPRPELDQAFEVWPW